MTRLGPSYELDGIGAALEGVPLSACPYKPSTPEGAAWCRGWVTGEADERTDSDRFGVSEADKTAVGLPPVDSVRGKGFSDDIHEMWRPKPAPALSGLLAEAERQAGVLLDAAASLIVTITDSAGVVALARACGVDLGEPPADPKARALARKAKPSVCPRHGPIPGGLCRPCQRGARR